MKLSSTTSSSPGIPISPPPWLLDSLQYLARNKLLLAVLCAAILLTWMLLLGVAIYASVKFINRRYVNLKYIVEQISLSLPLPLQVNLEPGGFPGGTGLNHDVTMYIDGRLRLQPHWGLIRPEILRKSWYWIQDGQWVIIHPFGVLGQMLCLLQLWHKKGTAGNEARPGSLVLVSWNILLGTSFLLLPCMVYMRLCTFCLSRYGRSQ